MRAVSRSDLVVALCFVAAGVADALRRDRGTPGLLLFEVSGALCLGCLAVRRTHPVVAIVVLSAGGLVGSVVTQLVWPEAIDAGGVWILALLLAAYSLGAYAAGRVVMLGVLLPAVVVTAADLVSRSGWDRINGMVFVTVFVGLLPTAAGRMVRERRGRLATLRDQHEQIARAQRAQQESAVLAERLRVAETLRPTLVEGLRGLAAGVDAGSDPAEVETTARDLLARTREEVVALTAPVEQTGVPDGTQVDHVRALRAAAQPWTVLAAGAIVAGLYVETSNVLTVTASPWAVLPCALLVGAPVAMAWRQPLVAATLVWVAAAGYTRLVAPLAGSLTGTAIAVCMAFMVGALSRKRAAIVGLLVCWVGQLAGISGLTAFGDAVMLLACWLGGLAVNEACRLVEQARANNELLARQESESAARAVVQERLRLAREIHDEIGHSLTVVALQAGAARRLAATDPGRARDVMLTVASVAAEGVAVLDHNGGPTDIASLVSRLRAAGVDVQTDLSDMGLLDDAHRLVAVRAVQEGLTNAIRHAPGARVTVAVRQRGTDSVTVAVTNSAPQGPGAGPGTGRGLSGIRERLVAAGAGKVTWGPVADGGFEICAVLPQRGRAASS